MKRLRLVIVSIMLVLSAACVQQQPGDGSSQYVTTPEPGTPQFVATDVPATAYPGPQAAEGAYPAPEAAERPTTDGRSQSAMESYSVAADLTARQYSPDALFYRVVPSTIMLKNLGYPPVPPGWFYKFKTPDAPLKEFIVQVVDGKISGSTVAEAVVLVEPVEQPINPTTVIDSTEVLTKFNQVAQQRNYPSSPYYDLELVNLEGGVGPVWSVVHPETKEWLYSVHAVTGEEVDNPHNR